MRGGGTWGFLIGVRGCGLEAFEGTAGAGRDPGPRGVPLRAERGPTGARQRSGEVGAEA